VAKVKNMKSLAADERQSEEFEFSMPDSERNPADDVIEITEDMIVELSSDGTGWPTPPPWPERA
jgi:hypothetical protein